MAQNPCFSRRILPKVLEKTVYKALKYGARPRRRVKTIDWLSCIQHSKKEEISTIFSDNKTRPGKGIDNSFYLWAKCVPMVLHDLCSARQQHRKYFGSLWLQRHKIEGSSLWAKGREKGDIKGVSGCERKREMVLVGVGETENQALHMWQTEKMPTAACSSPSLRQQQVFSLYCWSKK